MRMRYGASTPRAATAALAAVVLGLALTACGGDDDPSDRKNAGSAATPTGRADQPEQPQEPQDGGNETQQSAEALAVVKGSSGFEFTVSSAERDSGGFLTLSGTVRNISDKRKPPPLQWSGQETQVKRTGPSLGGMTLVDKTDKKRYYVLRDTDGYPLTTTGLGSLDAGESVDFFAQFPAPPQETGSVDLQIPLMPSTTIELG
ncbi:hypothetical protein [Streptomyces yaizuensis]|uniref:DUF3426 domain-containing protein n=1 Tax=Streptomyces yaizuensis TaxID=2989713 RepID=A0ABQ5NVK3_9ACTN|nr:hypothetical protein [Streptomyces sp. YSPA8]GLF94384.1 DUF3426 domain-containing protein [Streptomyces sp. YSPA8]